MADDQDQKRRRLSDLEARDAAARYEAVPAQRVNEWLLDLLPSGRACILDVGSGSGRDAAWLADLGHDVVAIEPDAALRRENKRHHPDGTYRLLADSLPTLAATCRTGLSFDFILVNAVWMFVAPGQRGRAFRKLVTLLKPGGAIALTLRGPVEVGRGMHEVSPDEIEQLARRHGAYVDCTGSAPDFLGRRQIEWDHVLVRVPDDGTGALPLIRRIVLNDDKSSTYKLALIRTISRVAHSAPGFAQERGDFVQVPLGIVALFWLRLYLPLLRQDIPQSPTNTAGFERLGFAKDPLGNLEALSPIDLRPGVRIGTDQRRAMHGALRDACRTIDIMPATHLTYPDGNRIFPVKRQTTRPPRNLTLSPDYLRSFGTLSVPVHLWRAMQRYAVWIEPALVEEWLALTLKYAERQDRKLHESTVRTAMQWREPKRDVEGVRRRAIELLDEKRGLRCVWTGKPLRTSDLDIDHCFPWSAWPCGDLWNLLPARRQVNQRQKRDLLPDDRTLRRAEDLIIDWWDAAYCSKPTTQERFRLEAKARLPAIESAADLQDVFAAVAFQRLRLSHDQQIPEWGGAPTART